MLKVTKEELNDFLEKYPNKLDVSLVTFCEPPVKLFYDFSIAEGYEAVVARIGYKYDKEGELLEDDFQILNQSKSN